MTTLAYTRTVVVHTTSAKRRTRTMLMSSAMIVVILGVMFVLLQSFLVGNHLSASDIEILRIIGAAFAPSIVGLLLALFGSRLPAGCKQ